MKISLPKRSEKHSNIAQKEDNDFDSQKAIFESRKKLPSTKKKEKKSFSPGKPTINYCLLRLVCKQFVFIVEERLITRFGSWVLESRVVSDLQG